MSTHATPPRRLTRWLTQLAAAAVICLTATTAAALSLEEVKTMASSGIGEDTLISIIENSGDQFKITPQVEQELRDAGVSTRIINALKATDTGSFTGGAGGTNLVPGPAVSGNLGPLIGEAGETTQRAFDIARAIKEKEDRERAENAARAEMSGDYRPIERLFEEGFDSADQWAALAACHNFLTKYEMAVTPDNDMYYGATWCKGQAYHNLGLHYLASPILLEVVRYGAERPHFGPALTSLAESADEANFYPPTLEELQGIYIETQTQEVRDTFNYFMGRAFVNFFVSADASNKASRYMAAKSYLEAVSDASPQKPKAFYSLAVMQSNPAIQENAQAVQNFQKAILAAEGINSDEFRDIVELSFMNLARVAYEASNFDGALYYYQKVDRGSSRYPQALFESAWTYFLKGDHRRSLGLFHSLHSPYYSGYYFPDLWVLEAAVYLNLCRYDDARASLGIFKDTYLTRLPLLTQFIVAVQDKIQNEGLNVSLYYDVIANYHTLDQLPEAQGLPSLPALFYEAVISNRNYYEVYKSVEELRREIALLDQRSADMGAVGEQLRAEMTRTRDNELFKAGLLTLKILRDIETELTDWDISQTEVSIDIDSAERQLQQLCLQRAARGQECEFTINEESVLFLVADDWQYWPFEGEYWADEVGNYKSYLSDRCEQIDAFVLEMSGD